jgi:isoleucyl-tRNA synthetase
VENKSILKKRLPADFIGEAQDQTRAWFYYQHVLAGALFGVEAFKHCIVTGIVLAEDGKKMSKKLKNYPDPTEVMEKYGADAMRFYMLSSPVVQADNLSFSERGVDEIAKKNISRFYNVLSFYQLYQDDTPASDNSKNLLDVWIISRLNELIKTVTDGYENYRVDLATRPLTDFIDDFSVWYLRRSRDRFKEQNDDKINALATLRYVLRSVSIIMAPAMPFFAEYIFQATRESTEEESVHLLSWPVKEKKNNADILLQMQEVRDVVTKALAQRTEKAIRVKQPLASLKIKDKGLKIKNNTELLELIKDEVNVKEVIFDENIVSEVELDINISEDLKEEGFVREIVRAVQAERKEQNLVPQDKISVELFVSDKEKVIIEKNKDFLLKECRAVQIEIKIASPEESGVKYLVKITRI